LKVGIISNDAKEWHNKRLLQALEDRGVEAHLVPITRISSWIGATPHLKAREYPLDDYDAFLVRRVPGGSVEQVFYRMDLLRRAQDLGITVMNQPQSIEKAVDKYYTCSLLEDAGIPVPKTFVTQSFTTALQGFRELGGKVVVKPLFGSLGLGMLRVESLDLAYRVFRALEHTRSIYYLQEYVPHGGEDVRLMVVGGEVLDAMKRRAESWKTNISGGGTPYPYTPGPALKELAVRACEVLGLDYGGVDVVFRGGQPLVLELNSTPGWRGLQSVSNQDITGRIVDHLLDKARHGG